MRRTTRIVGTLLLTGAAVAYLVWKIDLGTTVDVLRNADVAWFALAVGIMVGTVPALAFRWGRLLRAHGVSEPLSWLTRAYFVAYTAGQILPTSLGGDAVRVVETVRRNPGRTAVVTGTVVLERGLGGAATVVLGAIGFVFGTMLLAFVFFARSARPLLRLAQPVLERLRLARPLRAFYEAIHAYRARPRLLYGVLALTFVVQTVRVLSIWATARAVGIELGVRIYYVMGPLLFLVLLVPFTLNGFAVREAFFVSFLGGLGVGADQAFAAGFLFFLLTAVLALPGGAVMIWEGMRGGVSPRIEHG